jgi:hypothetical protein
MGQTSWITNAEGEEVYVDKGAITMPTPNNKARAAYEEAVAKADVTDFVQWPVNVHGQEVQGF